MGLRKVMVGPLPLLPLLPPPPLLPLLLCSGDLLLLLPPFVVVVAAVGTAVVDVVEGRADPLLSV